MCDGTRMRPLFLMAGCIVAAMEGAHELQVQYFNLAASDGHCRDASMQATMDAGVPQAIPGLRRLHLAGMAYNAIQIAIVLACIPLAFPMR